MEERYRERRGQIVMQMSPSASGSINNNTAVHVLVYTYVGFTYVGF